MKGGEYRLGPIAPQGEAIPPLQSDCWLKGHWPPAAQPRRGGKSAWMGESTKIRHAISSRFDRGLEWLRCVVRKGPLYPGPSMQWH